MARNHACAALVGMFVFSLVLLPAAYAGESDVKKPAPQLSSEEAIERALDSKISFDFDQTPLRDMVDFFRQLKNINIAIDEQSLSNAGILNDTPVTLHVKDTTLRSALKRLLASINLAYFVRDEVLQITTPETVASRQVVKSHDVSDLVKNDTSESGVTAESLIDVVHRAVMPTTWDAVGGPGSASHYDGSLIVSQTEETQLAVARLLRAIREGRTADYSKVDVLVWAEPRNDESKSIAAALDHRVTLKFDNTPLNDAVEFLRDQYKLPIVIDTKALEEAGVAVDAPMTVSLENVRLASALKHALQTVSLTYLVHDEFVLITTPEVASANLIVAVYGVRDLLDSAARLNSSDATEAGDELTNLITSTIGPSQWYDVGGPGYCQALPNLGELVIAQTDEVHAQIQALLKQLHQTTAARKPTAKRDTPRAEKFKLVVYTIQPSTPAAEDDAEAEKPKKAPAKQPSAAELETLLPELVAPDCWQKPQVLIRASGDRLFIRQTAAVHREIETFLGFPNNLGWGPSTGGGMGYFSVPDEVHR